MSEEWGPWIEHDGKGCPCVGMFVHVITKTAIFDAFGKGAVINSREWQGIANPGDHGGSWNWDNPYVHVDRYRIRKPRGLAILEEIANGIQEPVDA